MGATVGEYLYHLDFIAITSGDRLVQHNIVLPCYKDILFFPLRM